MCIRAVSWAIEQNLSDVDKLVLIVLADHANEQRQCWPSLDLIGRRLRKSRSTIKRAIRRLIGRGLLTRQQQIGTASLFTVLCKGVGHMLTRGEGHLSDPHEPPLNPQGIQIQKKLDSDGKKPGKTKPRHGQQTKDRRRIWLDKGTDEFNAYAQDYWDTHGVPIVLLWNESGCWFNWLGERRL